MFIAEVFRLTQALEQLADQYPVDLELGTLAFTCREALGHNWLELQGDLMYLGGHIRSQEARLLAGEYCDLVNAFNDALDAVLDRARQDIGIRA